MSERNIRRHQRVPYAGPVRVSWQAADGLPCYVQGKCLDVSDSGLRIALLQPVPLRTIVSFNVEPLKVSGSASVRHVSRRGTRFVVGLELNANLLARTRSLASEVAADNPL